MYSPNNTRRPSLWPRLVVALVLLLAGLGSLGYGLSQGNQRFADPLNAPFQSGQFTQNLKTGRYLIYAPDAAALRETPTNLSVTAPDGSAVAITAFPGVETQTRDGNGYTAYAQFHSSTNGLYSFSLAAKGPPRVIVARTLVDSVRALIGPAIEVVAGGLGAIIGFVLLLRAFARRRWHRRTVQEWAAQPPWAQPPYPGASGESAWVPPGGRGPWPPPGQQVLQPWDNPQPWNSPPPWNNPQPSNTPPQWNNPQPWNNPHPSYETEPSNRPSPVDTPRSGDVLRPVDTPQPQPSSRLPNNNTPPEPTPAQPRNPPGSTRP